MLISLSSVSSFVDISPYIQDFKLFVLPLFLVLFVLFSFRYISAFLIKFWLVEDLLIVVLFVFVFCLNALPFPKPFLFPSTAVMLELVFVYVVLRSVLVEKETGRIRVIG